MAFAGVHAKSNPDPTMSLKTLIVDDEPIARQILREELETVPDVEVVGEADNASRALTEIARQRPDLVLLDLQMPVMNGLDVVRNLERDSDPPAIVIVTAYDRFAIQAFEAGAIDYLLKPVRHERLVQAVARARQVTGKDAIDKLARLQEIAGSGLERGQRRIVGRTGEEYFLLCPEEIYAFQADGDIVWIVTAERKYQAVQTLKVLEERLRSTGFRRIHRNALVNVDHVRKMSALTSQRWLITLGNGKEFIASKRQAREVRQILHG
jgi:two-component system LytT family response regulator